MRAVVITKHGPPDVLQVQERPAPDRPLGGQVAIEVAAAGISFADTMARVGLYPDAPKPPAVLGYEVAGTVVAVGPGVDNVQAGQRVLAGTRFGGHAEQVVVKAAETIPLPDELSFEQGAAIPVNYPTAWAGLVRYGNVQRGERVLVHAAAGGVGIAATQIAKRAGAEVYGTSSPSKHEAIRGLGVEDGDRAEHAHAVGPRRHDRALDRAAARDARRRHDPAGRRRGLLLRPRRGRPPLHRRAPERGEGCLDAVGGRARNERRASRG